MFLPGSIHPFTSGTALCLSTPALLRLLYWAIRRWGVFRNRAEPLPAGSSAQTLPATDTGGGLKFYL